MRLLRPLTAVAALAIGSAVFIAVSNARTTASATTGSAAQVAAQAARARLAQTQTQAHAAAAAPAKTTSAKTGTYVFPVRAADVAFHTTHAGYPATDIFAACGKPVLATTNGVVLEISTVDRYVKGKPDGPYNGGRFVSIKGDDGVRYYGSHLSKVQPGIKAGVRVRAGQVVGQVGHTGNASGVCHLHYGISPTCKGVGDWKVRRGVVWPATYLSSWRKGGQKSPVTAVRAWDGKHHCTA
jgi:peptidoglycan LD-endopeptidase LytH